MVKFYFTVCSYSTNFPTVLVFINFALSISIFGTMSVNLSNIERGKLLVVFGIWNLIQRLAYIHD